MISTPFRLINRLLKIPQGPSLETKAKLQSYWFKQRSTFLANQLTCVNNAADLKSTTFQDSGPFKANAAQTWVFNWYEPSQMCSETCRCWRWVSRRLHQRSYLQSNIHSVSYSPRLTDCNLFYLKVSEWFFSFFFSLTLFFLFFFLKIQTLRSSGSHSRCVASSWQCGPNAANLLTPGRSEIWKKNKILLSYKSFVPLFPNQHGKKYDYRDSWWMYKKEM